MQWQWLEDERNKRLLLLGGGGVVAVVLIYFIVSAILPSGAPAESDPALARINKLQRNKDVAGLTEATKDANGKVAARAVQALVVAGGRPPASRSTRP